MQRKMKCQAFPVFVFSLVLGVAATAQNDDPPAPTPVPFTAQPRQTQWRIGFDLGNVSVLETPELNPQNDFRLAIRETQRVLPKSLLSFGLALLPFSQISIETSGLVNPRQWIIVDLHGNVKHRTFQGIGVFMGTKLASEEGGYHLVSIPLMPSNPFLGLRKEPSSEDLIFAFAAPTKTKLQVRTKLSETPWQNLLPVEDPTQLPAGYETARQVLDQNDHDDHRRFLYGTSIEASIQRRISRLWLLNYSHPDTSIGSHPWGIFLEMPGGLEPLYVFKPSDSDRHYVAYLLAAIDLNQDGTDELVVEATYHNGTAYKVISATGNKYQEVYTSYYRGPES